MPTRDPIDVRIGGKAIQKAIAGDDRAALENVSRAIIVCARLVENARKRAKRGRYATPPRPYSLRRPYIVSKAYAEALGSSKLVYKSSAAFHGSQGKHAGNVTGGMWSGLRVRNYGAKGAVAEFAGRSLGSRIKRRKRGGANHNVKVANKKKAARLFSRLRVNPIQPTAVELEALSSATTLVLGENISASMGGKNGGSVGGGDMLLMRRIVDDLKRGVQVRL